MKKTFSLIIPTYNEKDNIILLLNEIKKVIGIDPSMEVIIVDDDSPDLTWQIVEKFAATDRRVKVIRRTKEKGLSSAVIEGFKQAQGEILGVMDADLSHDCRILPQMIEAVEKEGCDLVVGSRRVPGGGADKWPWYRKGLSDIATRFARCILNIKINDPMSGYFMIRKELFERVKDKLHPRGYKILLEMYVRAVPQKVKEIPFIFKDRKQGYSKLTSQVIWDYLKMLYELRFKKTKIKRLC